MIEKRKMFPFCVAHASAPGLAHLGSFGCPTLGLQSKDQPPQGLVFDRFSLFGAEQARHRSAAGAA